MKSFGFLFGVIVAAVIGYAGFYFYNDTYQQTLDEMQNLETVSVPSDNAASDSANPSSFSPIPTDWQTFRSKQYGYSLNHPKDINTETTTEGDRFYKLGPTQSLGTELYDGLSLTIRAGKLNGKSLESVAKQMREQSAKEETTQSITELQTVSYGAIKGYQFRKSSLGDADFIYVQKSPTEYLEIINGTVEPKNRTQTFAKIVSEMISSIQFN